MSDWETAPKNLSLEDAQKDPNHPQVDAEHSNGVNGGEEYDPQKAGWSKPTKYNYEGYNRNDDGPQDNDVAREGQVQDEATIRASFGGLMPQWAAGAARYEWQEEYGDVAPRVMELEAQLFKNEFQNRLGAHMSNLEFHVDIVSEKKVKPITEFENAALHPVMLQNVKLCKYQQPTPIQAYCLPAILGGNDLIAVAQTGSGKTAAFLVPILSKLMGKAKKLVAPRPNPVGHFDPKLNGVTAEPLVLIVVPTRELAVQIFDEARRLCYRSMLRPCVVYGGGPLRDQQNELARGCDILIGTPGRLIDFMGRGKVLSLRRIKYTVIDEADEMIGSDWATELETLISGGDNNEDADHRYLMFSATFPKAAQDLAEKYLNQDHFLIKVGRIGSTHKNIMQHFIFADNDKKRECLRDLLRSCQPVRTIIFVNSKSSADEVDDYLFNQGFPSTSIHSDRTQREREDALYGFRTGKTPILVTTGVSARGLDVFDVGHVINYDLPKLDHGGITEYVHRIGRTGRIGNVGVSSSFYNDDDEGLARSLVKLLIENDQKVPDFLSSFKPEEGQPLNFDEDENTGVDVNAGNSGGGSAGGGGWGGDGNEASGGDAWGAPTENDGGAYEDGNTAQNSNGPAPADDGQW